MKCPECGHQMPTEGFCPDCSHLVIQDDGPADKATSVPTLDDKKPPASVFINPAADELRVTGSRDITAWLLGVVIYSLLLHPPLYYLAITAYNSSPPVVIGVAAAYVPVLLCTTDSETGRWHIKNAFVRWLFTKLNAIVFRLPI